MSSIGTRMNDLKNNSPFNKGEKLTSGIVRYSKKSDETKVHSINNHTGLYIGIEVIPPDKSAVKTQYSRGTSSSNDVFTDSIRSPGTLLEQQALCRLPEYSDGTNSLAIRETRKSKVSEKQTEVIAPEQKSVGKKLNNFDLAELLMEEHQFAVIENNLYYWNQQLGYYVGLVGDTADIFIRQNIPDELKGLISVKSCDEILRWIKAKDQIQISEKDLCERKAYVAYLNCIVRVSDFSIYSHKPNHYFTSVVNTEYPVHSRPIGEVFESFITQVTGGNQRAYFRLQELFGYVISEIRDVKAIPFLLGPKDAGKSIVLKLLEHMIGHEFFTNLSFDELNQPSFLCQLFGKKLNACGETSEVALNRLDVLKKLSGGDYVMARFLYGQAFKFINSAVLLFAGNHLPVLKGIDRSNAFSQRLVIFSFPYQVPKDQQDIHLFDKLMKETPYIAKWSLVGLRRWSQNNYQFTSSEEIDEIVKEYSEKANSIGSFLNDRCVLEQGLRIHNEILESAYRAYCRENEMIEETAKAFHKYLQGITILKHTRFRMNDANKNGYIGIALISSQ